MYVEMCAVLHHFMELSSVMLHRKLNSGIRVWFYSSSLLYITFIHSVTMVHQIGVYAAHVSNVGFGTNICFSLSSPVTQCVYFMPWLAELENPTCKNNFPSGFIYNFQTVDEVQITPWLLCPSGSWYYYLFYLCIG